MRKLLLSLTLLILMPFTALAQESGSVILGFDGESYEFSLDASQSDWSGSQNYGSVNIYTRPMDEETWALFKQLTLGFTIMNGATDAPEISLYRMVDGEMQKLFGKKDTSLTVTVDEAGVEGQFLTISGSFTGDLGASKNYGRDIDTSDPVAVSGTFYVTLGPVE